MFKPPTRQDYRNYGITRIVFRFVFRSSNHMYNSELGYLKADVMSCYCQFDDKEHSLTVFLFTDILNNPNHQLHGASSNECRKFGRVHGGHLHALPFRDPQLRRVCSSQHQQRHVHLCREGQGRRRELRLWLRHNKADSHASH